MFFSTKISRVAEELKRREDLREFLGIKEDVPETGYIYISQNSTLTAL